MLKIHMYICIYIHTYFFTERKRLIKNSSKTPSLKLRSLVVRITEDTLYTPCANRADTYARTRVHSAESGVRAQFHRSVSSERVQPPIHAYGHSYVGLAHLERLFIIGRRICAARARTRTRMHTRTRKGETKSPRPPRREVDRF